MPIYTSKNSTTIRKTIFNMSLLFIILLRSTVGNSLARVNAHMLNDAENVIPNPENVIQNFEFWTSSHCSQNACITNYELRVTGHVSLRIAFMSIVTRTGDNGTTGLMYNRRVSKCHRRVEAYGTVDELNAALGLARAAARNPFVGENLLAIQQDLIVLMGELSTSPEDLPRFMADGFKCVTPELTLKLDRLVEQIEAQKITYRGWALPGSNPSSAALDFARTTCRRAERQVCALQEEGQSPNAEIRVFLNRLSDLLWLFARWVEQIKQ